LTTTRKNNDDEEREKPNYRPVAGIAVISLLVCGFFFPLLITGLGQTLLPYQANGSDAQLNGRNVGSYLIDNNFTLPAFFHARFPNQSASAVDPHITLRDAYSQIPRIHNATGIPSDQLQSLVDRNTEGTLWVFGSPYLNVLRLNLQLIQLYPSVYQDYH
jgi:K+-transporting ATPase ATPase C chain